MAWSRPLIKASTWPFSSSSRADSAWGEHTRGIAQARKWPTFLRESTWHEIPFARRDAVLVLTLDRTEQRSAEERATREQANLLNLASDAIIVRDA